MHCGFHKILSSTTVFNTDNKKNVTWALNVAFVSIDTWKTWKKLYWPQLIYKGFIVSSTKWQKWIKLTYCKWYYLIISHNYTSRTDFKTSLMTQSFRTGQIESTLKSLQYQYEYICSVSGTTWDFLTLRQKVIYSLHLQWEIWQN